MTTTEVLEKLKKQGDRLTTTRKLMVGVFKHNHLPLSETEIRKLLSQQGRGVNKTTVYRELQNLLAKKIITGIDFGDGIKRYELNDGHHHHLICTVCRAVSDVHLENDLQVLEAKISKSTKFVIQRHSLEFFGLCSKCHN